MTRLYLHIPFCSSKCFYCSFSSFPDMQEIHDRYVAALLTQIGSSARQRSDSGLETLFIGGGTPTVLRTEKLVEIIQTCREHFSFSAQAEISIEANPGTIDRASLAMLRDCGVNRLSIGVQSFNDDDLQVLGRRHCAEKSIQSLEDARDAGFDNVSLDLMYGLPGQGFASWRANLQQAVKLRPQHLSLYQLSIEEGTGFSAQYRAGRLELPDDEEIIGMEQFTREYLGSHGIKHYEISNYARPGYECRHNIGYWENEEFVGYGAGAAGFVGGRRYKLITDPLRYCLAMESGGDAVEEDERLDTEASFRETVVMGLRLLRGVDKKRLFKRFGLRLDSQYGSILTELAGKGLLEENRDFLRLSARGRRFANQVMAELV